MEIYQLRTFVAVAQQGHLTQAAEILHLSQPAVTAQIKALEEETGLALFDRTTSGVMLTEAGKLLLPEAEKILAGSRDMLNKARSLKGQLTGKLRIGTIGSPSLLRLGRWLCCLRSRHPLLALVTAHGISGSVLNDVRKKELDGGFFVGKNPYQNVFGLPLREVRFRLAMPAEWAVRLQGADWRSLGRELWIGHSQFSSLHKLSSELWREHNISPKKIGEIDQEATQLDLVRAGMGLSLLSEEVVAEPLARGEIALVDGVEVTAPLAFIYPAERENDPLLQAMRAALYEVWELPA